MRKKKGKIKKNIAALQECLTKTRKEIYKQEDKLFELEIKPKMEKKIGNCYKYRNCYSCPQNDDDYWWLYVKILGVVSKGYFHTIEFQKDKYGEITIKHNSLFSLLDSFREITASEFNDAKKEMLDHVTRLLGELKESK